jgi:tRNA/rRNA methyltransferase
MRNFGLADLVLVSPLADPSDRQARQLSAHGETVLRSARIVPDLDVALTDCVLAAGTSARTGGLFRQQSVGTPAQITPRLVDVLTDAKVALLFGPESSGLSNAEITRCHFLIHIPADEGYPALNLAQAVAICLHELRQAWVARGGIPARVELAAIPSQDRAFTHLRTALEAIHFLYGDKADSLMHALRHLLGRARPTEQEVKLLHGLARQILWYVKHHCAENHDEEMPSGLGPLPTRKVVRKPGVSGPVPNCLR